MLGLLSGAQEYRSTVVRTVGRNTHVRCREIPYRRVASPPFAGYATPSPDTRNPVLPRAVRASLLALLLAAPLSAQLPAGWKLRPDAAAPDSVFGFVRMPPGWHLAAKGPGAITYDPTWTSAGRYGLEWAAFVFPSTSTEPFGIFIGGRGLEGTDQAYIAVQLTAQGQLSVVQRTGTATRFLLPATPVANFAKPGAEEPALNTLRVNVEIDSVRIDLNGQRAGAFARTDDVNGTFGFRVGSGANLHVSRLDRVIPLAPPRVPRGGAQ
jgi:hypothetical protein